MSVVLRCPNCGTAQTAPGECEACREAEVQYFCTNHSPGHWLSGPDCPSCGAVFGATESVPLHAPVVVPKPAAFHPPVDPPVAMRGEGRGDRVALTTEDEFESTALALAPWQKILGAVLRARLAPVEPREARATALSNAGGCLMRVALLALFVVVALIVALVVFGRALLDGLQF